jgi:hypothetical protein
MPHTNQEFGKAASEFAEIFDLAYRFSQRTRIVGKAFCYEFMAKHLELGLRCSEATNPHRAVGLKTPQINRLFDKLS